MNKEGRLSLWKYLLQSKGKRNLRANGVCSLLILAFELKLALLTNFTQVDCL